MTLLHRNPTANHEPILRAWYTERKQQLEKSLAATIRNGEYVTESDPVKVLIREWYMWAIQLIPSVRKQVQLGARADGMTRYRHSPGLPFLGDMGGGLLLPQVYAYNFRTRSVCFTDDLIFSPEKSGLFQLLVLPESTSEVDDLLCGLLDIDSLSNDLVRSREATVLIQSVTGAFQPTAAHAQDMARIATGAEFAADPVLCKSRPPPIGYDELRLKKEIGGKKYAILRHDRFVFAACDTKAELRDAAGRLISAVLYS